MPQWLCDCGLYSCSLHHILFFTAVIWCCTKEHTRKRITTQCVSFIRSSFVNTFYFHAIWSLVNIMFDSRFVGLDLFNVTTTRPSGHISHPTHVNVSQGCFHSLNNLIKPNSINQVWGLIEMNKFHQIGDDELYRMSDHSYQIEESRFS